MRNCIFSRWLFEKMRVKGMVQWGILASGHMSMAFTDVVSWWGHWRCIFSPLQEIVIGSRVHQRDESYRMTVDNDCSRRIRLRGLREGAFFLVMFPSFTGNVMGGGTSVEGKFFGSLPLLLFWRWHSSAKLHQVQSTSCSWEDWKKCSTHLIAGLSYCEGQ